MAMVQSTESKWGFEKAQQKERRWGWAWGLKTERKTAMHLV
jgi:hypothetical protein